MGNRSVRQCRERWTNYLAPSVINGVWSAQEDALLLEKFRLCGPHWKQMIQSFPGRTDINIKNHYMTLVRRKSILAAPTSSLEHPRDQPPETDPVEALSCILDPLFDRLALEWDFGPHSSENPTSPASQLSSYWAYGFPAESIR
jgi:hypothetical protein